jgi:hypothetical protein
MAVDWAASRAGRLGLGWAGQTVAVMAVNLADYWVVLTAARRVAPSGHESAVMTAVLKVVQWADLWESWWAVSRAGAKAAHWAGCWAVLKAVRMAALLECVSAASTAVYLVDTMAASKVCQLAACWAASMGGSSVASRVGRTASGLAAWWVVSRADPWAGE